MVPTVLPNLVNSVYCRITQPNHHISQDCNYIFTICVLLHLCVFSVFSQVHIFVLFCVCRCQINQQVCCFVFSMKRCVYVFKVPLVDTAKYIQSFRLQNLQPDTVYVTQVRCKNAREGHGYWSDWSANATKRTPEAREFSKVFDHQIQQYN